MRRILVILNSRAGTLLDLGSEGLHDAFASAFADAEVDVHLVRPRQMRAAIARAASSPHDTVVVGGGDGTVGSAAQALAGSGKSLGIVPLGTLNLLARDLGMPTEPLAAIAALPRARPRAIDLAVLNGRVFHSLSGLGFFSQMARAREEARDLRGKLLRVGVAGVRAILRTGRYSLEIEIDGRNRRVEAYALLVTVNHFDASDWRRTALDGGLLEVHIARDNGALAKVRAAVDLLTGDWRDNEGIESVNAREARITGIRRHAFVATDGELHREGIPLNYAIRPRALTVLSL